MIYWEAGWGDIVCINRLLIFFLPSPPDSPPSLSTGPPIVGGFLSSFVFFGCRV